MLTACGSKEAVETPINNEQTETSQALQIVTTIKPVQSIVLAILGDQLQGRVTSFQLIPDYLSPHDASFKPSDIRQVTQADIIFRIDEHMEVMLNPLLENYHQKVVSLADTEGVKLINWAKLKREREETRIEAFKDSFEINNHTPENEDDVDEGHADHRSHDIAENKLTVEIKPEAKETTKEEIEQTAEEAHGHEHHAEHDMHIWTSPKNTQRLAKKITQVLSTLDPKNKIVYEKNLATFDTKLGQESMQISQQLNAKAGIPYIVFHNSWQYFSHEFGLADPIVLNRHEGLTSGAKKINTTRDMISALNIQCIFTDPDITQSQVDALLSNQTENTIKVVKIDVLGRKVEPSQDAYLDWLKDMGNAISNCL